MPQPNQIKQSNLPGVAVGDYEDTTPGPPPGPRWSAELVSAASTGGATPWATGITFLLNELVSDAGTTYICITPHTAGLTFDATKFQAIGAAGGSVAVVAEGNLGANLSVGVTASISIVTGTLTQDCAIVTSGSAGDIIIFNLAQNSTGGWKATVNGQPIGLNGAAASVSTVLATYDGSIWQFTQIGGLPLIPWSLWTPEYGGYVQNATLPTANTDYIVQVKIPQASPITGITFENGSAGNALVGLCDANGARVAQSASTAVSGAAAIQQVPFTAPYTPVPGIYFLEVIFSSGAQSIWASYTRCLGKALAQGAFAFPASPIVLPTGMDIVVPRLSTY